MRLGATSLLPGSQTARVPDAPDRLSEAYPRATRRAQPLGCSKGIWPRGLGGVVPADQPPDVQLRRRPALAHRRRQFFDHRYRRLPEPPTAFSIAPLPLGLEDEGGIREMT